MSLLSPSAFAALMRFPKNLLLRAAISTVIFPSLIFEIFHYLSRTTGSVIRSVSLRTRSSTVMQSHRSAFTENVTRRRGEVP